MTQLLGILCFLVALPAFADTIGDLKSAVNRLVAHQPVRGIYAIEGAVKASGRFANSNMERTVSVEVAHDESGVSITIPQALIEKASQEAQSRNGAWDNAAERTIGSIRSIKIVEALNFRESLLGVLKLGTVTDERRVVFHGKPARMLTLKLQVPRKNNTIRIGTLKVDEEMKLWVGDDHLPLAAERVEKSKAGFLMFHGETSSRTSYTFAHTADRLILARVETSGSASGLGQKLDETSVQTVTLR